MLSLRSKASELEPTSFRNLSSAAPDGAQTRTLTTALEGGTVVPLSKDNCASETLFGGGGHSSEQCILSAPILKLPAV